MQLWTYNLETFCLLFSYKWHHAPTFSLISKATFNRSKFSYVGVEWVAILRPFPMILANQPHPLSFCCKCVNYMYMYVRIASQSCVHITFINWLFPWPQWRYLSMSYTTGSFTRYQNDTRKLSEWYSYKTTCFLWPHKCKVQLCTFCYIDLDATFEQTAVPHTIPVSLQVK